MRLTLPACALLVVVALVSDLAAQSSAPGIYVLMDGTPVAMPQARAEVKKPSVFKRAGFMVLTNGLASGGADLRLAGATAALRLPSQPEFRFQDTTTFTPGLLPTFYNPQTYVLLRLEREKKERIVKLQRHAYGAVSGGVRAENAIELQARPLDGGGYAVTLTTPLPRGEYAFVPTSGLGAMFDFGVD